MDSAVIHYRLDLVIRLLDTTTGSAVDEHNVQFRNGGHSLQLTPRGNGSYVLINSGREDFTLQVTVHGYEPCEVPVCYEKLDERIPIQEVFLIPSENTATGEPLLTFSGQLSGLEQVEAVSLRHAPCCIQEFDERKRIMKVFQKSSRASMEDVAYGLIRADMTGYERIEILKETGKGEFKLKEPLKEPFSVNSPIARVIFGKAGQEGEYILRVRDESEDLRYLVRYVVEGETRFQVVDFHQLDGVVLR